LTEFHRDDEYPSQQSILFQILELEHIEQQWQEDLRDSNRVLNMSVMPNHTEAVSAF
jgi:hypothetical protein